MILKILMIKILRYYMANYVCVYDCLCVCVLILKEEEENYWNLIIIIIMIKIIVSSL